MKICSDNRNVLGVLAFACFLLFVAFLIYLPSETGVSVAISPDSLEYSVCLDNLFRHGRFGFTLNGEWYPSRYSPWFSLLCLTPAYLLSGGDSLCSHWAIMGYALLLLAAIWRVGRLVGLGRLAVLPPIMLVFMPDFLFYSRVVLTEIPYSALFAIAAFCFVRFATVEQPSLRFCLWCGVLVAFMGLVRSTGFPMVVPFMVVVLFKRIQLNRKFLLSLMLLAPIVIALLASAAYNCLVFGSPFRNGYMFWNAVPLDFPHLTFNYKYVAPALSYYLRQPIIHITLAFMGGSLLMVVVFWCLKDLKRHARFLLLEGFAIFQLLVLLALYIGYYWSDTRFFLPISIFSVVLFFYSVVEFLRWTGRRMVALVAFTVITFCCAFYMLRASPRWIGLTDVSPVWLASAQISGRMLPCDSVVLQRGDPNLLDHFAFRNKHLRLFPLTRGFDYFIQMTAPASISKLYHPKSCWQYVIPDLVASGVCGSPFPTTFRENPDAILQLVSSGKRVFLVKDCYFTEADFKSVVSVMESMGLTLRQFGEWNHPGFQPNIIRHLYDTLLFPCYGMDSCPEFTMTCYEIILDSRPVSRLID